MPIVKTKTTYLEMHHPPSSVIPAPCGGIEINKVEEPTTEFYRYLYRSVGGRFSWVDRLVLSEDALNAIIQDDRVDIYVLAVGGQTAGYAELDRRKEDEIELAYFGLFPQFLGQGLGKFFLSWVLRRAWSFGPRRVWVHTCDLDHPAAIPTYLKAGFTIYNERITDQVIPDADEKGKPTMNKVLIIVGDATETVDTLYPYYRLIEGGFQPVVAAPEKRRYQMVLHEVKPGWTITKEWEGYTIEADVAFRAVKPEEYLGIFFSGGRAPEYLRYDDDLVRITRHFFDQNKPVGCVCHGVEIPAYAGCVKGRRMATVTKCKFDLEVCGGTFVDEPCVIDGNLVSGRTYHDHGHYIGPWIAMLGKARDAAAAAAEKG